MYKVIYNDIVIDVLEKIKYARYLTKSKHTVVTGITSANCIIASNNKDKYHIKGTPYPNGCNFKTVSIVKIDEEEFNELYSCINGNNNSLIESGLRQLKQNKIKEMSEICHSRIVDGVRVLLSDNKIHHFELQLEDQVNLLEIKYLIDAGQDTFIYHETDGLCKEYSLKDMRVIVNESFKHKQHHITYFNYLKNHISNLTSIDEVIDVKYDN